MMTILGGWASVLLILLPGTAPAYAEPLLTPQPVEARQLSEYFTPNYFINRSRHLWPKAQWSNTLTRFSLLNTEHVKFLDACQKHTAILVSEDYSDYSTAKNPHFNELYILDQQQNIINKYKTRIKDPSYFRAQYSPNCEKMLIWTRGFPPSIFNFKAHKITSQFPNPELQGTASFFFFSESQVLYQVFNEKDHLNSLYVLDTKNSQKTPKPIYSDKKYFRLMTDPDSKGIALIEDNSGLRRLYLNGEMEIIASKKEKTPRKLVYLGNNIWAETLSQPLTGENSIQLFLQNNESVRISGFDPIRVDSRYFVYSSLAGSNEVILNLFDLRDRVSRKLTSATRIGLSLPHITHGQIYAEFNANFERETLLNYDLNGGERVLFKLGYKHQEVTVEPHLVESSDNFKYPAYKYSMPTRPARGVIVFVQGGGCHVDTPYLTDTLRPELYDMISAGYDVFAISYRNNKFAQPTYFPPKWTAEVCGTKEIDDIVSGAEHIQKLYPHKPIFLWGHSQGAYLANLTVTKHAGEFPWTGAISGAGMWKYSSEVPPAFMGLYYSPERAPLDYLGKLKTPLYLYHGQADHQVSVMHALWLMKEAGLDTGGNLESENTPSIPLKMREHQITADQMIEIYTPANEEHHITGWDHYAEWINQIFHFLTRAERMK